MITVTLILPMYQVRKIIVIMCIIMAMCFPYCIGGCTSLVQPLDVSFNKPFKAAVEHLATQHMRDNLNAYVRNEISASVRRILFTKWVGQAWEEVSSDEEMVVRSFRKVGIALPIDGSEDSAIHIKGLEGYSITDSDDEEVRVSEEEENEDPFASCATSDDED